MIFNGKEVTVLAEEFKQRAYDGKTEKLAKIMDLDNAYTYINEIGSRVTLIPEKWVCVDVLDNGPIN